MSVGEAALGKRMQQRRASALGPAPVPKEVSQEHHPIMLFYKDVKLSQEGQ